MNVENRQDQTHDGRPFRVLTIVDEFTWECLALQVPTNGHVGYSGKS